MARSHDSKGEALLSKQGRLIAWKCCNGRCPVCSVKIYIHTPNRRARLQMDHIEPCSGGGHHRQLVPLCASCNASKGATELSWWLPRRVRRVSRRIKSEAGSIRAARRIEARIYELQAKLSTELVEAGIW